MAETLLTLLLLYVGLCAALWLACLTEGAAPRLVRQVPGIALVFLAAIGLVMRLLR